MAIRVIDDTKLQNIAVAIQGKDGGGQMTVDEMPTRIENIPKYEYEMLTAVMNKTATEIVSDKINQIDSYSCASNQALKRVVLNSANFYGSIFPNGNSYVFHKCENLKYLLFPNSVDIPQMGFGNYYAQGCVNLLLVIVNAINNLGGSSFMNCRSLKTFIIRKNDQIQQLENANIFNDSGISSGTGFVYVPDSLKSNYQNATNWSVYSSQIRGYQDAPDYSISNQYTVGDVCKHNNKFYAWINLTGGNSEPTNAVDTYTDWYCAADIEVI